MEIDKKKCVGCGNCHAVCTMGVIYLEENGKSVVNQDECDAFNPSRAEMPLEKIRKGRDNL